MISYVGRFDALQQSIAESQMKNDQVQSEIETKNYEYKLLEATVENFKLYDAKKQKSKACIEEERAKLQKQI